MKLMADAAEMTDTDFRDLLEKIEQLKNSEVKKLVDARINEFKELGKKSDNEIFSELCFCILTANFNAERSIKIQNDIKSGFCNLMESQLVEKLRQHGHRFPEARAKYIVEARGHKDSLKELFENFKNETGLREWLAKNVRGLGYKEASHFMRNIGFTGVAIVDFHIIDLLVKYKLIEWTKTLTPKKYLEIENLLREIAKKVNLNLAELDLYLWYIETGKVLK